MSAPYTMQTEVNYRLNELRRERNQLNLEASVQAEAPRKLNLSLRRIVLSCLRLPRFTAPVLPQTHATVEIQRARG